MSSVCTLDQRPRAVTSLGHHTLRLGLAAIIAMTCQPVLTGNGAAETALSCPAMIAVAETTSPSAGWQTASTTAKRKFERVSIYNGKNGSQEFELAPDDEKRERGRITQIWRLSDYRSMNLFLRCRYSGTEVILSKDIPAGLRTCSFSFRAAKDGAIQNPSFECH